MKTHYLAREPGLAIPFLALFTNVLVVATTAWLLQTSSQHAHLAVFSGIDTETINTNIPVLKIRSPGDFVFQEQAILTLDDLRFKLSATASKGSALLIWVVPGLDSQYLIQVLELCNRSGFTDIALRPETLPRATD